MGNKVMTQRNIGPVHLQGRNIIAIRQDQWTVGLNKMMILKMAKAIDKEEA